MDIERTADKNDVDISILFKWNKKVEIRDILNDTSINVYIRLLGDADVGRARAHAYRKSGEYRKVLKSPDSGERLALLAEMDDFSSTDIIIKSIILLRFGDYYQKALKNVDVKEPREPNDDDQVLWEDYQRALDEYPEKFKQAVMELAEKYQDTDEKLLVTFEPDNLYRIYETEVINRLVQERMTESFYDMCLYLATYTDDTFKTKAFKTIDDAENAHEAVKTILIENYKKLELGPDVLKKLPGVAE
jgi:hypothetical protein